MQSIGAQKLNCVAHRFYIYSYKIMCNKINDLYYSYT